jgi:predicted methyltransferase
MPKKISCIILACDSYINKGNSIFHCLWSVANQDYGNVEVIIVENSHKKPEYLMELGDKFKKWVGDKKGYTLKIISNRRSISRSRARNVGLSNASGSLIVFLDDDTIILNSNAFSKIAALSQKYDYGYGANRLWTKDNLFQKDFKTILGSLELKDLSGIKNISGNSFVPGRQDGAPPILLSKTFIANFGFCKKHLIEEIGGFPDFPDYGYEDDYVIFRLYLLSKKLAILDNMTVVHVNHETARIKQNSLIYYYFNKLVNAGYYWFHISKIFENNFKRQDILEPLKSLHFDQRVERVIKKYVEILPINLNRASLKNQSYWRNNNLPSRLKIAQLIYVLYHSLDINDFIKKSSADFDNLAELVRLSCEEGIVKIDRNGSIKPQFEFIFTTPRSCKEHNKPVFNPKEAFNQFPCDEFSRARRYKFIKERYPYAEYLKFGIIGDDDYISLKFVNDYWAWPVIIEKDKRIIDTIGRASDRFEIVNMDVAEVSNVKKLPEVQTFITDPPYTLHGALSFIYCGLKMLVRNNQSKEFYVILNPTMMGKNLQRLQEHLIQSGIFITEVIPNFSQYDLPKNYQELKRAKKFLNEQGVSENCLTRSSSSNLYIFSTATPDLNRIKSFINYKKIYNHYDH